ncbi:histamine N-methyltransferase B-like [Dendronephthya gigantea]|uniref:histamine N-methyltransferase B-like n=1 Tax=Dendronephthya gigantea TaxID=151771 RepID=UPI001069F72B|nr:histamine N-methyltransferase B-like [Dendronephthya gigantea]
MNILDAAAGYAKRHHIFKRSSNQDEEALKMLQTYLPIRIEKLINSSVEKQCELKILSVGGGTGEIDLKFVEILLEELKKHSSYDQNMKIYLRVVEPNSSSCKQFSDAVEARRRDLPIHVDIRAQTFEEYIQNEQNASTAFDIIHFIHSVYFFEEEKVISYCLKQKLKDRGCLFFLFSDEGLLKQVSLEIAERRPNNELINLVEKNGPKLIESVEKRGWKYEVHSHQYPIDVSEILVGSESGDLLLDFITHEVDFRKNADASLVDRVLAVIKNTSFTKDGKYLCMKTDTLLVVHK